MVDTILIQLGANDIVHLTPLSDAMRDLETLLQLTKRHSKKVIFFTSGNVGSAPLFPFPVSIFYRIRSNYFFGNYKKLAQKNGVPYVELYLPWADDPFVKNPSLYYASDSFHVTNAAYELWYQKIKAKM